MSNVREAREAQGTDALVGERASRTAGGSVKIEAEDLDVGPHYPSGANAVEMGLAMEDAGLKEPGTTVPEAPVVEEQKSLKASAKGDPDDPDEPDDDEFDPSANNIDDVLAYVDDNPDEADRVLAAEKAGKNRTTLVSQLEAR